MICAGIDAGSRSIKVVLLDTDGFNIPGRGIADQGVRHDVLAERLFRQVLRKARVNRRKVCRIVATGCGRNSMGMADTTITEITCHARGVRLMTPRARTVIDIGGQDSKLIRLNPDGAIRDFAMNDRCAAGTGRFLEVVASRLETSLKDIGKIARRSTRPAAISSTCVVFAETEIIGLLASKVARRDIIAGVQAAIASRIASMAGRNIAQPVVFTGGVALIRGMDKALESALGHPVTIAPFPQYTGALGAALLAAEIGIVS